MLTNENTGRKKAGVLLLVLILLLQLASLVFLGKEKEAYHIDEIYTYILSNSHDADRITNQDGVWDTWIDGGELSKLVTVQDGERFAYDRVYSNNSTDAHPPLYYYLVHTVCSLTPGTFSKWSGLGLNYFLFVLAQLLLFLLCREISGDSLWSAAVPAVYGGTVAAIDTAMFIRMYMLITVFTLLLALIQCRTVRRGFRYSDCLLYFAVTFCGVYSHYFFAVAAFFMAAWMCLHLLCTKQIRGFFCYAFTMLAAVALVFAVYPAAFTQIGGSETNNVGKEVAANILDFSGLPAAVLAIGREGFLTLLQAPYHCIMPAALVLAVSLAAELAFRNRNMIVSCKGSDFLIPLGVLVLFALAFVTAAHLAGKFSYLRYVYNILPLLVLGLVLLFRAFCRLIHLDGRKLAVGLIAVGLLCSFTAVRNRYGSYLFKEDAGMYAAADSVCEDRPLVLLNDSGPAVATYNFSVLEHASELYMTQYCEDVDMDRIVKDMDTVNGVAVMLPTDDTWTAGYDGEEVMKKIIDRSEVFTSYEKAMDVSLAAIYILK